eukprot:Tbor_TRINITY_DN5048_c1_g2::TRINITY_DN5048_c1_g2_i1::g.14039::m.14039
MSSSADNHADCSVTKKESLVDIIQALSTIEENITKSIDRVRQRHTAGAARERVAADDEGPTYDLPPSIMRIRKQYPDYINYIHDNHVWTSLNKDTPSNDTTLSNSISRGAVLDL